MWMWLLVVLAVVAIVWAICWIMKTEKHRCDCGCRTRREKRSRFLESKDGGTVRLVDLFYWCPKCEKVADSRSYKDFYSPLKEVTPQETMFSDAFTRKLYLGIGMNHPFEVLKPKFKHTRVKLIAA